MSEVVCADALDWLRTLADGSVDMAIANRRLRQECGLLMEKI